MAKPEWGTKRICLSCGARFYDLNREPIVCPACGTPHDPMAHARPRRSRAAPKLAAVAEAAATVTAVEVEDDEEVTVEPEDEEAAPAKDDADEDEEDEDTDSAIEDVSELADDDMTDVIDTEIDEDETDR